MHFKYPKREQIVIEKEKPQETCCFKWIVFAMVCALLFHTESLGMQDDDTVDVISATYYIRGNAIKTFLVDVYGSDNVELW